MLSLFQLRLLGLSKLKDDLWGLLKREVGFVAYKLRFPPVQFLGFLARSGQFKALIHLEYLLELLT